MRTLLDTQTQRKPTPKAPALSRSGFPMKYIDDLAKQRAKVNKLKDKIYAKIDSRIAG